MKSHPLLFPIVGFLTGVAVHSLLFTLSITIHIFFCIALIALLIPLFWYKGVWFIYLIIFCVAYVGGLELFARELRASVEQQKLISDLVGEDQSVAIIGMVVSEPLQRRKTKQFTVEVNQIQSHNVDSFKVLIYVDPYQSIDYGDRVVLAGELQQPENFVTDSGRTFDYIHYLSKDSIYYTLVFPALIDVSSDVDLSLFRKITYHLYTFKNNLVNTINKRFPQPESGLLAGILFGKKDALDEVSNEQFRKVGLMHIVVLSGYNVSLVIALIMKLLYFLPLRVRSVLAVLGIIGFALLVGAGPTVVRASIMALFIVLSENVGRRYSVHRGLIAAGVIMVIINPWVLLFDISFQLSFLATYGLITFSPYFEKWLYWIPSFLELRASAVATLSAQVIVTPILLYGIGDLSIISPLVNVLVLFAVPWSMLLGFIASFSFIPYFFSFIAYLPMRYITWVVEHLSTTPLAVITIPPFHVSIMVGMYVLIVLWYWYLYTYVKLEK